MKYMLLIIANREEWQRGLQAWRPEDIRAMTTHMNDLNRDLAAAGELVEGNGLAGPAYAKTVRARPEDEPLVTDGPFPESKEVLAGYWVVDVPSEARAIEIAARASAAPGPGGIPLNQPIEVHPVAEAPEV
jgi:hypothetical protein